MHAVDCVCAIRCFFVRPHTLNLGVDHRVLPSACTWCEALAWASGLPRCYLLFGKAIFLKSPACYEFNETLWVYFNKNMALPNVISHVVFWVLPRELLRSFGSDRGIGDETRNTTVVLGS